MNGEISASTKGCKCPCSCNGETINSDVIRGEANGEVTKNHDDKEKAFLKPLQGCIKLMEYDSVSKAADFLLQRTGYRPKIAVICGSGLGGVGDALNDVEEFPYEEIPNFPITTAPGHKSKILFGILNGVEVMMMQGRFHLYEAYPINLCCMPVRVMKMVGVKILIATNAAGGLNSNLNKGDIMVINDHLNFAGLTGVSPLCGPNDERFGPRFFPLDDLYEADFRKIAAKVAEELEMSNFVKEGTYALVGGPNFETPLELRLMKTLGVDAVGMSTVHEAITAKHCGMTVFAFSLITNIAITEVKQVRKSKEENEEFATEVLDTGKCREKDLQRFLAKVIERMNDQALQ